MYSIDLSKITLKELKKITQSIDLIPSRKILLLNIDAIFKKLESANLKTMSDLQEFLKKKSAIPKIAKDFSIDENYLIILNREVNSYVSKPIKLDLLEVFNKSELKKLENRKIKNTKQLYEIAKNRIDRKVLSNDLKIDIDKLTTSLELIDLLRVNGIGPTFAILLHMYGIKNKDIYYKKSNAEIANLHNDYVKNNNINFHTIGEKDAEFCKRYCKLLDSDIEW